MELDEESGEMVTIKTYCGLFQYNRLLFEVKTAPSIIYYPVADKYHPIACLKESQLISTTP